jgi:hypothetical protein
MTTNTMARSKTKATMIFRMRKLYWIFKKTLSAGLVALREALFY